VTSYEKDRPDEKQIGGKHYVNSGGLQCWDFILKHRLGYLEGNFVKYVTRNRYKEKPLQDLKKARHYAEKIMQEARKTGSPRAIGHHRLSARDLMEYAVANDLNVEECNMIAKVDWHTVAEAEDLHNTISEFIIAWELDENG
jgi:hypothetical protein